MNKKYLDAVRLLLDAAPDVFRSEHFVLKGGTAINLFVRNLPRLSVDLDLVYRNHRTTRQEAIGSIQQALDWAREALEKRGIRCRDGGVQGEETKLFLERAGVRVKIEVNHVFRGTLLKPAPMSLVNEALDVFFSELELPILAKSELYASKLVAAMDRQHPRDLFDMRLHLEEDDISPEIMDCFVVYLAGHNRPLHEVLFANKRELSFVYANEFQGMTRSDISLDDLVSTQAFLLDQVPKRLTPVHREFLIGLASGEPDWSLLPFSHIQELPALRWKLANLKKLKDTNHEKFNLQRAELERGFNDRR